MLVFTIAKLGITPNAEKRFFLLWHWLYL